MYLQLVEGARGAVVLFCLGALGSQEGLWIEKAAGGGGGISASGGGGALDPGRDTSSTSGGGRAGMDTARRRCDFGRLWVLPGHLGFCSVCDAGGWVTARERHDPQPGSPSSGRFLPRAWWSTSTSTPGFALLFLPFIHSSLASLVGSFSSELASYICGPQNSGQTKEKPTVLGRPGQMPSP